MPSCAARILSLPAGLSNVKSQMDSSPARLSNAENAFRARFRKLTQNFRSTAVSLIACIRRDLTAVEQGKFALEAETGRRAFFRQNWKQPARGCCPTQWLLCDSSRQV